MKIRRLLLALAATMTLPSYADGIYENLDRDMSGWPDKLESRGFLAEYDVRRSGVSTLDVDIHGDSISADIFDSSMGRPKDARIIHSENFTLHGTDISAIDAREGKVYGEVGPIQSGFIMSRNAARGFVCTQQSPCHLTVKGWDGPSEPLTYHLVSHAASTSLRAFPRQVHVNLKRKRQDYLASFHPYIEGMVLEVQSMRGKKPLNSITAMRQYVEQ